MIRKENKDNRLIWTILPMGNFDGPAGGGGGTNEPPAFDSGLFRSGASDKGSMFPGEPPVTPPVEPPVTPPVTPPVEPPVITPANQRQMNFLWDKLKKDIGDEYVLPDVVTKGKKDDGTDLSFEEEYEIFRTEQLRNTDFGDDDFVQEYREAKKTPDFDRTKFIQQRATSPDTLDDDSFLFAAYKAQYGKTDKNPSGWDDNQIKSEVGKMSLIAKKQERTNIESVIKTNIAKKNEVIATQRETEFNASVEKANIFNNTLVSSYLKSINGKNTIEGMEFGEADINDYYKSVPEMMKVNIITEKDGSKRAVTMAQQILEKVLATDEGALSLLPYLYMIDKNKIKGYSSFLKESVKKELEKKLGIKPDDTPGGSTEGPLQFDSAKFRSGKA